MTPKFRYWRISFWAHWGWFLPLSLLLWKTEPVKETSQRTNKHEAGADLSGGEKSSWCCMYSQHRSGTSRGSPCTPSWWFQPAGIDVPAPRPRPDTPPHSLWKPAPSLQPTPWLNRKPPGQESCWRTPVRSHGAGCEKTPTWKDGKIEVTQ